MKICFLASNPNILVGSYRIWIRDLTITLQATGQPCTIVNSVNDVTPDTDVVILSKADFNLALSIKQRLNCKVGCINLAADNHNSFIDFIITGSIEESVSLSFYENVFLYPLIELDYQNIPLKKHYEKPQLKICFHGHYPHLAKFNPHLKTALELFAQEANVELNIITGHENFNWKLGKPNIPTVYKQWAHKSFINDVQECDIGIVPNATDLGTYYPQLKSINNSGHGLYDTDYNLRFKNKSNAGRAFVFFQLGIPVIADLTPSNLHILGDPSNGYCAHDTKSWLRALRWLKDHKNRTFISTNANTTFNTLYNPTHWATRLIEQINKII